MLNFTVIWVSTYQYQRDHLLGQSTKCPALPAAFFSQQFTAVGERKNPIYFFFFCFLNFQINLKCHNFVNIQYINISLHEDKTKYMIFALHTFPQSSSAEGTENFLSCPSLAEHDQLHSKFDCLHSQRFVDPNEF